MYGTHSLTYGHCVGKREFGLSDKDIASLQFQGFACSRKTVYSVDQMAALAKRKYEKTGIEYPKMHLPEVMLKHVGMEKTSERLTGLLGRDTFYRY